MQSFEILSQSLDKFQKKLDPEVLEEEYLKWEYEQARERIELSKEKFKHVN